MGLLCGDWGWLAGLVVVGVVELGALAGWSAEFGGFWSDGSVTQNLID